MVQIALSIGMKVLDSFDTTTKSILVYKNKILLASLMVGVSGAVGAYFAMQLNNKFSKESTYVNIITCSSKESAIELVEYLRSHKIKNIVTDSYTRNWDKTLSVQAFASTREQSKLIDSYLENKDIKYLRQILD